MVLRYGTDEWRVVENEHSSNNGPSGQYSVNVRSAKGTGSFNKRKQTVTEEKHFS